jgi:hypothetical protein
MPPVAVMGGSPRIIQGKERITPWGRAENPEAEKAIRREIAAAALKALRKDAGDAGQ